MQGEQLVARIKRSSKYYGQTAPNAWFEVRVVNDFYHLRGNNNAYRVSDVIIGVRLANGDIVDLRTGKVIKAQLPRPSVDQKDGGSDAQ